MVSGLAKRIGRDTDSALKFITRVASCARTVISIAVAVVINRNTDLFGIEEPSVRAFQTNLIFPIPGSATEISRTGIVEVREDTLSFLKIIPFIARSTISTLSINALAKIRRGDANFFVIEYPSFRALEANLVVPIPKTTARVSRLSIIKVREDALSLLDVISLEAGSTISIIRMSFALVRDGNADFVGIEDPSV